MPKIIKKILKYSTTTLKVTINKVTRKKKTKKVFESYITGIRFMFLITQETVQISREMENIRKIIKQYVQVIPKEV